MYIDRRGFLRFGLGGAVTMALSAAAPLFPTDAYAIAGVDDAVVGGVLLVMLTLAGYAVSDALLSTNLSAMGYDFSRFASDADNQAAAVTRAIADANNLSVQVNRQQAEDAAAAIAAGTGAAGEWLAGVADSGRIALDGWLSGIGSNQAAIWGLVAQYAETVLSAYPTVSSDAVSAGNTSVTAGSLGLSFRSLPIDAILSLLGNPTLPVTPTWMMMRPINPNTGKSPNFWYGDGDVMYFQGVVANNVMWKAEGTFYASEYQGAPAQLVSRTITGSQMYSRSYGVPIVSDNVFSGALLPGVDKAADAPETYGAGYDKTILGNDLVIDPATGDVVSAGTIALPVDYPYVQLPYVDGLYQQGAGVVSGLYDLPISGQTSAVVGTEEGVVSMPISQAISTQTSLAEVVTPAEPVVPPGTPDVGPWTPAYNLPFYDVWPFNLVYSFVSELSALGGA